MLPRIASLWGWMGVGAKGADTVGGGWQCVSGRAAFISALTRAFVGFFAH